MGKNNTKKEWYKERITNIIISQHGDGLGIERQGIWTKILGELRERELWDFYCHYSSVLPNKEPSY